MKNDSRIFVAGHNGLVGSSIYRHLTDSGYSDILVRNRAELNLEERESVFEFFAAHKPEFVFVAAAKVGGIYANNTYPVEFIRNNIAIQWNIIEACHKFNVQRLIFLGSSCIYPVDCPRPIKETYFCSGSLEPTNRAYAIAKISGIEHCWSYNRQMNTQYLCLMPTNMYGPNDNYHLENSHVLPAMIRKMHDAKQQGLGEMQLWGSGKPKREFLYSDDLASACCHFMNLPSDTVTEYFCNDERPPIINVGTGKEISIFDLAYMIKDIIGYEGKIAWDASKPDGVLSKVMDVTLGEELGWKAQVSLRDGIGRAYKSFLQQQIEFAS
jgi:GDP-L-fucose synthase